MQTYDIALVEDQFGGITVHALTCPAIDEARLAGRAIITLLQCTKRPPATPSRQWHKCLKT